MSKVALVTAKSVAPPYDDPDMEPSLRALRRRRIDAQRVCWDDPTVNWNGFDLVILRSTWDYVDRYEEFFEWLTRLERDRVDIMNPVAAVRWTTDKRYLKSLEELDIAVVPTLFFGDGDRIDLPNDWTDLVVKPSIGAGAKDAARHGSHDGAREHIATLTARGRTAMVQPYLRSVDEFGETGLVYFNGKFNHAFRKSALLNAGPRPAEEPFAPEEIKRRKPSVDERELADSVVDAVARQLLYARVDVVRGSDETPLVLEVELAEPSFFLTKSKRWGRAARDFAVAVKERLAE